MQRALRESNGNRTLAARKLGIHLASLYRKIAKYKLT
ncbi:helix-turn-helix domain-containing protein [Bacillus sp. V5-8f]|nr:helix-turn-helix domain-containing protein [Bacillus sp. V5-8f]